MTKEEILAMEAGEKLDGHVAKEIMGLEISFLGTRHVSVMVSLGVWSPPVCYSTDISAAWQVWVAVTKDAPEDWAIYSDTHGEVTVEHYGEDYAHGGREKGCGNFSVHGLFPVAICKAALLAKLKEVNDLEPYENRMG